MKTSLINIVNKLKDVIAILVLVFLTTVVTTIIVIKDMKKEHQATNDRLVKTIMKQQIDMIQTTKKLNEFEKNNKLLDELGK